jgi:hypothetical protein
MAIAVSTVCAVTGMMLPDGATPSAILSAYDESVLADSPSAYWALGNAGNGVEADLSGSGLDGSYSGSPLAAVLPNGDPAADFDGAAQYFEAADADELSPATTGELTIEAWMRPDTLDFANDEGAGYVHWMGKGITGAHEYVSRMYSDPNTADRGNRISGYLFNASGGLGAGSYFQDPVVAGEWIHYVLVINYNAQSTDYPHGYTKIYRDGVLRDQDDLNISGTVIVPERGNAPFRVGTRDFGSYFEGAVGKVAIFDSELSASDIADHYSAMTGS